MAIKLKTQDQVDSEINRLIALAIRQEEKRDKQEYESIKYWFHHDRAVEYHLRAEKLMPK